MKHPLYPNRTIRHAKLLLQAGFKVDRNWAKGSPITSNTSKLIYWKNDDGINIVLFDYERISLQNLIKRIIKQTQYTTKQKCRVVFD